MIPGTRGSEYDVCGLALAENEVFVAGCGTYTVEAVTSGAVAKYTKSMRACIDSTLSIACAESNDITTP